MTREPFVTWLTGAGVPPSSVGGKAAALDRLVSLGARVPTSAVVTTAAYRSFVGGSLGRHLDQWRSEPSPAPSSFESMRQRVDRAFLDAPMPDDVRGALRSIAARLAGHRLAVRSSATAEDLDTASFAGQYRTSLDVPADELERAVRLTWASLWHPGARAYRATQRAVGDVAMAVLVMDMVDAERAGVYFTRDPIGSRDALRIEIVEGPGELLVSGESTPEALVVARATAVDDVRRHDPVLGELVELGLCLEERFGVPLDIEWAIDGEQVLWALQARPITTTTWDFSEGTNDRFDTAVADGVTLTTAGIEEMAPGVLPPLIWDALSWQLEEGFRRLLAGLGAPLATLADAHEFVARVHGRAVTNLDHLGAAASAVPGGSPEELERRYFGDVVDDERSTTPRRRHAPAWHGLRILRDRHRWALESEVVIRAGKFLIADEPRPDRMSDAGLVAYRNRLLDLGARTAAAEIAVASYATSACRGVEALLARRTTDDRAAAAARQLISAAGHIGPTANLPIALLTDAVEHRPELPRRHELVALDWTAARKRLVDAGGGDVVAEWETALSRAGCRSVFAGPTWDTAPELAWLAVRTHWSRPATRTPTVVDRCEIDPDLPWIHRQFVHREVADASDLLARRERTKRSLLVLGGVVRRVDDEVGRRLLERGTLRDVDEVRLMTGEEVASALLDGTAPAPAEMTIRARALGRASSSADLPRRFVTPLVADVSALIPSGAARGWAASPGRHTGRAVVLDSPVASGIRPGDVIVARSTDASWAPLFSLAGALVVERGGPLSHASILARELGLPAVVNLPGIVDRIGRDGTPRVAVDGSRGIVQLLDEPEASEEWTDEQPADPLDTLVSARTPPVASDPNRLGVFVTGLIGAGALLSATVTATEAVSSAGARRRVERTAGPRAERTATMVVAGPDAAITSPVGLARPSTYRVLAVLTVAVATLAAVAVIRSGLGGDDGDVVRAALAVVGSMGLLPAARAFWTAAHRWPDAPPMVRRAGVQMTGASLRRRWWSELPSPYRRTIASLASIVGVLFVLAVVAESVLMRVDEPLYDALGAGRTADLWQPDWWDRWLGRPQVVIPVALAVVVLTFRCRVLALAYPIAIVLGGFLNLGLGALVGRARPPLGEHADQFDSFPSGSAIEAVLLFGLFPLALAVLLRSPFAGRVARVVSTTLLILTLADGVRAGSHWPTDWVAGVAIALVIVVYVHGLARAASLHDSCTDCPTLRSRRPEAQER